MIGCIFFQITLGLQGSFHANDLFSTQSKEYASSRPTYPSALFEFIVGLVDEKNLVWDCATGNGQAALVLADYFKRIVASDISARQLEMLSKKAIFYIESFLQNPHCSKTIA